MHLEEYKYIHTNYQVDKKKKDLNIKPNALNLIEENVRKSLELLFEGKAFLNWQLIAQTLKIVTT